MPTGYAGMIAIAMIPPLWFRIMNPLVTKYRLDNRGRLADGQGETQREGVMGSCSGGGKGWGIFFIFLLGRTKVVLRMLHGATPALPATSLLKPRKDRNGCHGLSHQQLRRNPLFFL